MSLPRRLRKQIETTFDLEEIKNICFDLSFPYDELPGDRLSSKVNALFVAAYKTKKIKLLREVLADERPDEAWPTLAEMEAFGWEDLSAGIELPPSILNQVALGDMGAGAAVVQGDHARVQTGGATVEGGDVVGDQIAGNKIIQNIQHIYQEDTLTESDVNAVIGHLTDQLNYTQILYFAFTGLIAHLTHYCLVFNGSCTKLFGTGAFDLFITVLIIFGAVGLITGAIYGYALVYLGDKVFTERFNLQLLSINISVFALSFFFVTLFNNDGSGRGVGVFGGLIVGGIFGLCLTIPGWIRSVSDRLLRVLLTVVLAVSVSFAADYLFGFPVTSLASQETDVTNSLFVWIVFGGSLSFYYSIWPQDIANILVIAELED